MNYTFLNEVLGLMEEFEINCGESAFESNSLEHFKQWIAKGVELQNTAIEPQWEGKDKGRSPESIISTLVVHLGRYAKTYSRSAILGSEFSTQEEFIYLINLRALGPMTKMELIRKNIQDKPVGIKIINRLLNQQWVSQQFSADDKRSKVLEITDLGLKKLDIHMQEIRQATRIVSADLTLTEKMTLIHLLSKLERFHKPIFLENVSADKLLDLAEAKL